MRTKTLAMIVAGTTSGAFAQTVETFSFDPDEGNLVSHYQVFTDRVEGYPGDGSALRFISFEGNSSSGAGGTQFGVLRLDLGGFSGQNILDVSIDLRKNFSRFTDTAGQVSIGYSPDDLTDLTSLRFDDSSTGGLGAQLEVFTLAEILNDNSNNNQVVEFSLGDSGGFFQDIRNGGIITLVFQASEPTTAGRFFGPGGNRDDDPPVLNVTVPSPGSLAVLGIAGLAAGRRRRVEA